MARLQILELPDGPDDTRPPFVLVVDEYAPRRYVLGSGQTGEPRSEFHGVAETIGARAILTFVEPVEIPANEVTVGPDGYPVRLRVEADLDGFRDQVARELGSVQSEVDRMDAITDALGLDRLRNWDEITTAIRAQRKTEAEGGHRFNEPGFLDPHRCAQCRIPHTDWVLRGIRCESVQAENGGE